MAGTKLGIRHPGKKLKKIGDFSQSVLKKGTKKPLAGVTCFLSFPFSDLQRPQVDFVIKL